MKHPRTFARSDLLACAGLLGAALAYGLAFFDFARFPSEDAAMLMRYAEHLGGGHGIVWNIGGQPVDGATDFLFMVLLGGLCKLGMSVGHAVIWVCSISHLLTTVLVYWGARRFFQAPVWAALLSGLFIALGPGTLYTEAYFGTPFFALFVAMSWIAALRALEEPSWGAGLVFAFTALLMGLVRPEGVLVAVFVLVAMVYRLGLGPSRRIVVSFAATFLALGGAYFVWRMEYFGQPLPNPFYAKQGGHLYTWALALSIRDVATLAFPFNVSLVCGALAVAGSTIVAPDRARLTWLLRALGVVLVSAALLGLLRASRADAHDTLLLGRYSARYTQLLLRVFLLGVLAMALAPVLTEAFRRFSRSLRLSRGAARYLEWTAQTAVFILIPVVGFTLMWGIIEDHTNYLMRFRYPIVPVIVMSWPFVLAPMRARWPGPVIAGAVVLAVVLLNAQLLPQRHHRDGRHDVAVMLNEYAGRGYSIATTEAGLLPLYSRWPALDLFGLNDPVIARSKRVGDAYLDEFNPAVIVIAAPFPIERVAPGPAEHMRRHIVTSVHAYALARGYTLAAAFGADTGKVHYYYVNPDIPDGEEIVDRIRSMDYPWYLTGDAGVDFAAER